MNLLGQVLRRVWFAVASAVGLGLASWAVLTGRIDLATFLVLCSWLAWGQGLVVWAQWRARSSDVLARLRALRGQAPAEPVVTFSTPWIKDDPAGRIVDDPPKDHQPGAAAESLSAEAVGRALGERSWRV